MGKDKKTMVVVFAGANGSGKSTITELTETVGMYINADEIKKSTHCTDLDAAITAQNLREQCIKNHQDFTFETVLSTTRNLELLKSAKMVGMVSLKKKSVQDMKEQWHLFRSLFRYVIFAIYLTIQKIPSEYSVKSWKHIGFGRTTIGTKTELLL